MKGKSVAARWGVATLGLVLVALGVALSLKSNLGTAPVSCPPAMLNLRWTALSVGTFTWMMHLVFIAAQMAMTRKVLDPGYLLQIAAAFVFGYLCDGAIWLLRDVTVTSYFMKLLFCLGTVVITAVGVRLEVIGNAWMLAGEKVVVVFSDVTHIRFSNAKVGLDVLLVILSAAFAWAVFGNPAGNASQVVIREGTLILALCTGLCMKLTDPLVDRLFKPLLPE